MHKDGRYQLEGELTVYALDGQDPYSFEKAAYDIKLQFELLVARLACEMATANQVEQEKNHFIQTWSYKAPRVHVQATIWMMKPKKI